MAALVHTIISWSSARNLGLKHYFTGKSCKRGHVALRYANGGYCVECAKSWPKENKSTWKIIQSRSREKRSIKISAYRTSRTIVDREYQKQYQKRNKQKRNAISNKWYWGNKELIQARLKSKYRSNVATHRRNRKARKRNAPGRHTSNDISIIYKAQNGKCAYCRRDVGFRYHVDHIIALINGGSNWPRNLQLLCAHCNLSKHARDPIEFARSKGMLL